MKKIIIPILISLVTTFSACTNYLDVVPDNVGTIDNAFTDRTNAEKYLFTCYSYLPEFGNLWANPAFFAGDEFWTYEGIIGHPEVSMINAWHIARGNQNANDPYLNYYEGAQQGKDLWQGIRTCNIFLENISKPKDLTDFERTRWIAEVKFLKAYMHYWLLRMYGPIPIVDENLPVSASPDAVKYARQPFDQGVQYIADLMTEAARDLPLVIENRVEELGRITKPIALAMKAEVLITAASPLFNGNTYYSSFANPDGTLLFGSFDANKWKEAADACKVAIDTCELAGIRLYAFQEPGQLTASTRLKMSIRGAVSERWNDELIWGATVGRAAGIQANCQAYLNPATNIGGHIELLVAPPLRIAREFYTSNGVPVDQDKTWSGINPMELTTAPDNSEFYIEPGHRTIRLHLNREPRFYATLGVDGGYWYGQGKLTEADGWVVNALAGQTSGRRGTERYSATGYFAKKLVNYRNTMGVSNYSAYTYPFPVMRLADLYLMYAEALNESSGPGAEVYDYIDRVRERAGLNGVRESWTNFSTQPGLPDSQDGLREIIHKERLIELACEGKRYWDIRRWKQSEQNLNGIVYGFNCDGETPEEFYKVLPLFVQKFTPRDYLWPIRQYVLSVNGNMVQAPGW